MMTLAAFSVVAVSLAWLSIVVARRSSGRQHAAVQPVPHPPISLAPATPGPLARPLHPAAPALLPPASSSPSSAEAPEFSRLFNELRQSVVAGVATPDQFQRCRDALERPDRTKSVTIRAPLPPMPPEATLPVRRTTTPVRAWRTWHLEYHEPDGCEPAGWYLHSVTLRIRWDGPILRADGPPSTRGGHVPFTAFAATLSSSKALVTSTRGGHVPFTALGQLPVRLGQGSGHGIYAFRTRAQAADLARSHWINVMGEVELLGTIVAHTRGYRAEIARIASLTVFRPSSSAPDDTTLRTDLERRYQCPVTITRVDW